MEKKLLKRWENLISNRGRIFLTGFWLASLSYILYPTKKIIPCIYSHQYLMNTFFYKHLCSMLIHFKICRNLHFNTWIHSACPVEVLKKNNCFRSIAKKTCYTLKSYRCCFVPYKGLHHIHTLHNLSMYSTLYIYIYIIIINGRILNWSKNYYRSFIIKAGCFIYKCFACILKQESTFCKR